MHYALPSVALCALVAVGCMSVTAPAAAAVVQVPHGFYSGNTYRVLSSQERTTYVTGLFDGLVNAAMLGASNHVVVTLKECAEGMDNAQLTAIVDKYLNDHPEFWHYDMGTVFLMSIRGVCPKLVDAVKARFGSPKGHGE